MKTQHTDTQYMKLSSLTPTDKIKLAAELDGWWINAALSIWQHKEKEGCPPNYHDSYDAIILLIQKRVPDWKEFAYLLAIIMKLKCRPSEMTIAQIVEFCIKATPSQLLDALLVAAGKATL
jgi:hypothetical protein